MLINTPMNVFTVGACIMLLVYFCTRIGDKAADWTQRWIVVCIAIALFCIGIAPMGIWHMFTGGH